jgi:hypothetical protein
MVVVVVVGGARFRRAPGNGTMTNVETLFADKQMMVIATERNAMAKRRVGEGASTAAAIMVKGQWRRERR